MKRPSARLCIAALILSILLEPYTVSAAAPPAQKESKMSENTADTQEQPLTSEEPATSEEPLASGQPAASKEPLTSDQPVTSEKPLTSDRPVTSEKPLISDRPVTPEKPLTEIPVRLTGSDAKGKTVTLEWDGVYGVAEYSVFLWKNETWEEINKTQQTTGTFSLTEYGTEHIFKIRAYDNTQKQTGESAEIKVLIPEKVKTLTTTAYSKTNVKLYWEAAKGANSYEIYEKQNKKEYKLVKTVEKTDVRLDVKNKESYQFKVVPLFKSTLGAISGNAGETSYENKEFVSMNHQKYTYKEMREDIQSLCKKYSEYVSYEIIGFSEDGRAIYDVILGNKKADKSILVVSTLHAREYIATVVCMKQLEYYLLNYNKTVNGTKLSDVFAKCNVHYVMMANPDGVTISQTKKALWKANANGVNLNRNFPYAFKKGGRRKNGSYSGSKAASASETQAVISLTKKLNQTQTLAVVNYHAMGQIVFGDYGGKNKSLRADIKSMYQIARRTTGYSSAAGYGGSANGNYREYLIYKLKVPSVTIEIGSVPCPVPKYQYASAFKRNKLVVLKEAIWLKKKK